jgi:flagellar hook-length control protein FliK
MGLSITSSPPKGAVSGIGGQASTGQAEVAPGDFLALLSSELGNFLLPSTENTTESLASDPAKPDEKLLSLATTETINPQVDPALIAALSAAGKPTPAIMPAATTDTAPLISDVSDSTSPIDIGQAQANRTDLSFGKITNPNLTSANLQINPPKTVTTSAENRTSPDKNPQIFSAEITKQTSQPTATVTAAIISQPNSVPSTTNSEFSPFSQARIETSSLTDAPQPTQLTIGGSGTKPAEHIESDLRVNIQEKTWPQQFGEKIVWMAKADVQSAQININPPELGPIQITLNLSGDQAKLSFASPHLEVRQTIENALSQLKEMLSSSGINLGQANVGANLQQQPREPSFQNTNGRQNTGENAILSGSEVALATGSATLTQRGRGLVDLFA